MLYDHSFEFFLTWSNEKIKASHLIALFSYYGGSTRADILTPDDLNRKKVIENICSDHFSALLSMKGNSNEN